MSKPVMGLGIFVILLGLWIAVSPEGLVSVADWESRQGLNLAGGMRIVTGLILIVSASATRYPRGLRIFGGIVLLAGLGILFIPLDLWVGLIHWWLDEHLALYRLIGGIGGILLGAFLVHAALPERSASDQVAT